MPLRALHLSASFPRSRTDAVAPFLLDLVDAERAAGWDVSVVASHDAGLPGRQVLDGGVPVRRARYAPERFEVVVYRGGGHGRLRHPAHVLLLPGVVISLLVSTWRELRRRRPDVLHAHWLLPGGLVGALVPRRGARLVLTLHGTDAELATSRLAGPLARFVARRADVLLAVSEPLARRAEEVLRLPQGAVGVARLPLPSDLVPSPLPDGELRLLAAGRASHEKGLDVLLAALRLPDAAAWKATLVTEGPERAHLEALARPIADRVQLLDLVPRRRLFELIGGHHAVVVPSRSEGLGLFAVEALALGRPVVASEVGGLIEVVVPPEDGALVPPDDPAALAAALAKLAHDLHAPAATVVARHTPQAVIADHRAAYGLAAAGATS
jgi:glycosyltransferase involved in cell wall biosynthesis